MLPAFFTMAATFGDTFPRSTEVGTPKGFDAGLRGSAATSWPSYDREVGYWVLEALPATRESARRLGLVTLPEMIGALAGAVEHPASGVRVFEVPQIRLNRL